MKKIKDNDNIHLLGCQIPEEMKFYKDMPFITSVDSSNPIMSAIDGVYYSDYMHDKPKANMNNSFDVSIGDIDLNILDYNVNAFKQLFK